jgi:hypothetical protein
MLELTNSSSILSMSQLINLPVHVTLDQLLLLLLVHVTVDQFLLLPVQSMLQLINSCSFPSLLRLINNSSSFKSMLQLIIFLSLTVHVTVDQLLLLPGPFVIFAHSAADPLLHMFLLQAEIKQGYLSQGILKILKIYLLKEREN